MAGWGLFGPQKTHTKTTGYYQFPGKMRPARSPNCFRVRFLRRRGPARVRFARRCAAHRLPSDAPFAYGFDALYFSPEYPFDTTLSLKWGVP
jgi:hypothetical protein